MDKRILQLFEEIWEIITEDSKESNIWKRLSETELQKEIEKNKMKLEQLSYKLNYLITLYQDKYGVPEKLWNGNIRNEFVLEAEKFLEEEEKHPFVFNMAPRIFSRKPKRDDYETAVAHIRILEEYYKKIVKEQESYAETSKNFGQIVEEYSACRNHICGNIGHFDGVDTDLKEEKSEHLYIGDILIPLEQEKNQKGLVKKVIEYLYNENLLDGEKEWLKLPLSYSYKDPFVLFINYSYREEVTLQNNNRLTPIDLIHSVMYQILYSMPAYTYSFLYFDPIEAGKQLEEFQCLSSIVNGNAYWLREDVFNNTFRVLVKADDIENMQTKLKGLVNYISKINQIRCGENIISYNARQMHENGTFMDEAEIIPQKFVFFENTHKMLNQTSVGILQTVIKNARECGISLILISKHKSDDALDDYERLLIRENTVDVLEWNVETENDYCSLSVCGTTLGKDEDSKYQFNFQPFGEKKMYPMYLEQVCGRFKANLDIETRFEKVIHLEEEWGKGCGDEEIEIPIGINTRGKISMISLGGSTGAHALLAGSTGCGKSSLLHTIINGIIMRYRPEDVQIWLSDYKSNEFCRYMENTPTHIKYVATDRSMEYSLRFLDKIYEEYQRRIDLFGSITSVKEYRRVYGKDSMPRLIVIVDEFHVMSNHVKDEPIYKRRLASILREARSVGVTLLLSDQTCGVGLQGLTDDGKNQLTCRIAMRTTMEEYNAVFNISNAKDVIPTLQSYEIVLQRTRTIVDSDGKKENKLYYEHSKTIYINNDIRDLITRKSIEFYGPSMESQFFVNEKRNKANWSLITLEEKKHEVQQRTTLLYLGVPADLNKFLKVILVPNYGENVMSIGSNFELQSEILVHIIESIKIANRPYQILILAAEYDALFGICKERLYKLSKRDSAIQIMVGEESVCQAVVELEYELAARRKQCKPKEKFFVFWLGLDELSREFEHYSEKRPEGLQRKNVRRENMEEQIKQEKLEQLFGKLFEDIQEVAVYSSDKEEEKEENETRIYNANADICELMKESAKKDIHHLVFFSSVQSIKRARCVARIYTEEFKHKIAFRMSRDDASEYLGRSNLILTLDGELLDEETAVYYDGMTSRRFVPFISVEEKNNE